ncbi:hypothetical protein V9T40_006301 [Parthenolecanium corni]|uniref:RNA helicase aquarius n=1 Tax=Parthenolecanium corni TaxID=536013 RepID=A0AAN9TJS6_9HEMI
MVENTAKDPEKQKPLGPTPTVDQIISDRITQLANQYWAPYSAGSHLPFNADVIENIYFKEILLSKFSIRRVMMLEFSQYLENYLWPNFTQQSTFAHTMSIVSMLNEKFRERVPAWEALKKKPEFFPNFFQKLLEGTLSDDPKISILEHTSLIVFLTHCFNSMEEKMVRDETKKLTSLLMWMSLQQARRNYEFKRTPEWEKRWKKLMNRKESKKNKSTTEEEKRKVEEEQRKLEWERKFLHNLMLKFLEILESIPADGEISQEKVHYCERFLELMIDLEALLLTRRFFNVILDDVHLVVRCQLAPLNRRAEGKLFSQLLDLLKFYSKFEINDITGDPLTDHDMMLAHYSDLTSLQRSAFAQFPELRKFALATVAQIDTREALQQHFKPLNDEKLQKIAVDLRLIPSKESRSIENWYRFDFPFLLELLVSKHERRPSQLEELNTMPLYPTEDIIWNENIVPTEYFSGDGCLALPKLNLQFLTLHDYLLRNFNLFRLESTYEIRQDIEYSLIRLTPWKAEDGGAYFGSRTRMAHPISNFTVIEVLKAKIGEKAPARVKADVTVQLNLKPSIKAEWENLRKHDVCFLITVKPTLPIGTQLTYNKAFLEQTGLAYVRGCEVEGMLDKNGRVIEEGPEPKPELDGDTRTYRVLLDQNQYKIDMDSVNEGKEDVYETFNVLMRRAPKENNFKAVLETIRTLMNTECVVPDWIHDIILGYGNPGAAHYIQMPNEIPTLDFNDTFLDVDHLRNSFPNYDIEVKVDDEQKLVPPFRITFKDTLWRKERHEAREAVDNDSAPKGIVVEPYVILSRGPYHFNEPKKNTVPFTATQVEAIRSGMQPGLTLVVGPPGTGKTDVAVQIISNIYHNFPNQRTLIVTHSNQALNQLFEKIMMLDIDERHLLRLGHGEEALETEKDFSRYGRVNYVLTKRLELLNQVKKLQHSLEIPGDDMHTCETAGHFFLYRIVARWEKFLSVVKPANKKPIPIDTIEREFPFHQFFDDAPKPLFKGRTYEEDLEIAEGCYRYIEKIFTQLEEFRAFELLRSGLDRSKYLLVMEAKIIAMTCTHAALKRQDLVDLGFKYDNILMEEAAQILEIETFIPLLLQNPQDGFNRLKRWIMIGDHHQLPPVIKNMAFQKYSNMEQSLFTRLVRIGVPTIDLDCQGRARSSICNLYNWRYKSLGNLSHIENLTEYQLANAGFTFEYQLINVEDFEGAGESEPRPFFYQNLAEAEYCVALFMYMRLIGYPAHKITILTTYNGQKQMIREIIQRRCATNPLIGMPHKVTTVDKFQGQQNDYILLSLVRTRAVGHLRDIRRLVVAMSRARLGLYIFARISLFKNCFELTPAFNQLMKRPPKLHIHPEETYPTNRLLNQMFHSAPYVIEEMSQMTFFVYEFYMRKVQALKETYESQKTKWIKPGIFEGTTPNRNVPIHPGGDRDTDSEDEEEKEEEEEPSKEEPNDAPQNEEPEIMETTSEPVNPDDIGLSEMEDLTSREQSSANEVTEEVESDEDKEHAENSSEKMDEADV